MKIKFNNGVILEYPIQDEYKPEEALAVVDIITKGVRALHKTDFSEIEYPKPRAKFTRNRTGNFDEMKEIILRERQNGLSDTKIATEILHKSKSYVANLINIGVVSKRDPNKLPGGN